MENPEEVVPAQFPPQSSKPLVVFVDDEPEILIALERALRGEPDEVYLTTNPQNALQRVRTHKVSVVVTDHRMPDMDGTTVLRRTREASPRTARVLLTAHPGDEEVLRARQEGLLTLFRKPWDVNELKRALRHRAR